MRQVALPPAARSDRTLPVVFPLLGLFGLAFMLGGGQAGSVVAILSGVAFFATATVGVTVVRLLDWCDGD